METRNSERSEFRSASREPRQHFFFSISCASSQEKINDSGGFFEFPWKTAKAGVVSILIFTAYVTCYQDHAMKNLGENHRLDRVTLTMEQQGLGPQLTGKRSHS
jgi:hypothetical protein